MAAMGEGLALVSGFSFAAASAAVARRRRRGAGDNGMILSVIITVLVSALVWMVLDREQTDPLGHGNWLRGIEWFVISGLLTIVFGRALLFRSIEHLGAVRASAVKRLNPFFSVMLAVIVLGETMSPLQAFGTALIALSFAALVHRSVRRDAGRPGVASIHVPLLAYAFGPAPALCYAAGYLARKAGLNELPDASLGTLVGALAGLLSYLVLAVVRENSRKMLAGVLANATRWQFAAALFISVGQLSQFAAISYIEISRVVMIASLEIFMTMILSVYVVRTEKWPDLQTILAALAATVGAVLVALA